MATTKTKVIESLFEQRWDKNSHSLTRQLVTLHEVIEAIAAVNETIPESRQLSPRNPANFFKDFVRRRDAANTNWPQSVLDRGYTARQRTGGGDCFEFVPLAQGQPEPFPSRIPEPDETVPRHRIQSASLPLASRRLGRADEPWLIQVLVRLKVVEAHLAIESDRNIVHVDHLQMSVKLSNAEIDAIFLATEQLEDGACQEILVPCEAKGRMDDILVDQILTQVKSLYTIRGISQDMAIPIALKAIGPSEIYLVEFSSVLRADAQALEFLPVQSTAIYELVPEVPGIGR